jgi:N,N'-diacetylchitobiose transport system substrate-binding protein
MRARSIAALATVAVLGLAVSTAGADTTRASAGITVWLQVDAQSGWPDVVAAANAAFRAKHPGVDVNVQYQTWGTYQAKFEATLAGGNSPDVMEVGNTHMTKYMAAGAFQDITGNVGAFDNSANWLEGLAKSGRYQGKVYGVPYYAGSRVITYRKDLYKNAGISKLPDSLAMWTTQAKKLGAKNKDKGFSPVYIAGTDWYFAMSFVYDHGGSIAKLFRGKWKGTLDTPKSIAGLQAYKRFFNAASRASKTTDEARPQPYDVYAQGRAASIAGPAWFSCCVGDFKGVTGQFVPPGSKKGLSLPGFLGGSDLAVPVGGQKALAVDWIAAFTSTASEKALQAKGNIPNATNLLGNSVNERAAKRSWFTPQAKNWANVESGNVLRTMLAQILTGKLTVKQAAQTASENITFTLNQGT